VTSELDKFIEERSKIPIPSGDVARIRLLAQELALGVHRDLWFSSFGSFRGESILFRDDMDRYVKNRWGKLIPGKNLPLLRGHGYVEEKRTDRGHRYFLLTKAAFDLIQETQPYNIFISYRRLDSSALALLVLARLKEHELFPFVDMALEAGGNWHADLEERIKGCDYFIILLGKETLSSPMTVKEIQWALQYEKTIIPLWHSGFVLQEEEWPDIPPPVRDAVQQTNAIIVQDESASGYNTAIVELLNRFGVTP